MKDATVTKLHPETESRQAPAIGMSVVMNMPGDRQATLQCFVAQEDGEAAANELLDRMFRISDRQRARYELKDLEDQLEKHQRELFNFEDQFARVEKIFAEKKVEREEEAKLLTEQADELQKADYEKFRENGRQGAYKPQGHVKQQIDTKKAAARTVIETIGKAEAERLQELGGIKESQARFKREIERLHGEIGKRKALLGANDGA